MTDGMRHLPCGQAVNSNNGVPVTVQHPWDLRTLRVLSSGLQTSFIYIIVNGNTGENPPEL